MMDKIPLFLYFVFILWLAHPTLSESIFSMQPTLTIRCDPFPLISNVNDTDLKCARLRINENDPLTELDLDRPTQITLFTIVDPLRAQPSPVNISLTFHQSSDSPSPINEIYLSLLVTRASFTINNQTNTVYAPFSMLTFHWQASNESTFELIDELVLEKHDFEMDTSLCKWEDSRWNHLFHGNASANASYVYFLKTNQAQLAFTLADIRNRSDSLPAPTPYLNVLYCIPYRLGTTEIVLIICFCVTFITVVAILSILHFLKGGEDNRALQLERYHQRHAQAKPTPNLSQQVRHRASAATSAVEQDDQAHD